MARPVPAIVILGNGSLATARKIAQLYPGALIHGLAERVEGADRVYHEFGATLHELYQQDTPIIALCAAGIVIRTLAPLLLEKGAEPPVLAVAEDGSAVVPLLGGLGGVNVMAREIAAGLEVAAAITTSGELRFGTCLLNPPSGYALGDLELGKRFVSDLLAGQSVRVEGAAPWLVQAQLPQDPHAQLSIHVGHAERAPAANELMIYPRNVLVAVSDEVADLSGAIRSALHQAKIAVQSVACLLASDLHMANPTLREAALELGVPLRFASVSGGVSELSRQTVPNATIVSADTGIAIAVATEPLDATQIGRARGRLAVIGLGPGAAELMVPAVKAELARATDVLGYETYVRMAGPFREDQVLHCTDNREEMQRARHAFELAAQGRSVIVVSSGDPGVFAMAAAVLEALHESSEPSWHSVDLEILPGVSASLATAAQAGAPLLRDVAVGQPQALGDHREAPGPGRRSRSGAGVLQPDLPCPAVATGPGAGNRRPASHTGNGGGAGPRHWPSWPDVAGYHAWRTDPRPGRYAHHGADRFVYHLRVPSCRGWRVGVYAALVRHQACLLSKAAPRGPLLTSYISVCSALSLWR